MSEDIATPIPAVQPFDQELSPVEQEQMSIVSKLAVGLIGFGTLLFCSTFEYGLGELAGILFALSGWVAFGRVRNKGTILSDKNGCCCCCSTSESQLGGMKLAVGMSILLALINGVVVIYFVATKQIQSELLGLGSELRLVIAYVSIVCSFMGSLNGVLLMWRWSFIEDIFVNHISELPKNELYPAVMPPQAQPVQTGQVISAVPMEMFPVGCNGQPTEVYNPFVAPAYDPYNVPPVGQHEHQTRNNEPPPPRSAW